MSQEAERTYRILMDHCRKNWLVKKQNRTEVTVIQHSHEGQVQAVTSGSPHNVEIPVSFKLEWASLVDLQSLLL